MFWVILAIMISLSAVLLFRGRAQRASGLGQAPAGPRESTETDGFEKSSGDRGRFLRTLLEAPLRIAPSSVMNALSGDLEKRVPLSGMTLEQMAGFRFWGIALLPVLTLTLFRFSTAGLLLSVPALAAGAMLPVLVADRARERYLEGIRRELPNTADMLYALVLGGRNLDQAFRGAAHVSSAPLHSLLMQTVREMDLGTSREESFNRLLDRCPLPELSTLLRSLLVAERRGHPLAGTLEVFARELRLKRRDRLRVLVAKAPLKMLAPLVFLILPASVILTVGPTLLSTISGSL